MEMARSGEAAGQWKKPVPLLARLGSQGGLEIVPQGPAEKRAVFALQSQHPTCWAVGSVRLKVAMVRGSDLPLPWRTGFPRVN